MLDIHESAPYSYFSLLRHIGPGMTPHLLSVSERILCKMGLTVSTKKAGSEKHLASVTRHSHQQSQSSKPPPPPGRSIHTCQTQHTFLHLKPRHKAKTDTGCSRDLLLSDPAGRQAYSKLLKMSFCGEGHSPHSGLTLSSYQEAAQSPKTPAKI